MNGTFLSQFWKRADLWNLVEAQSQLAKGFNELIFNLLRDQQPHQKSLIAITIWTIWKCRNELIWEHIYTVTAQGIHLLSHAVPITVALGQNFPIHHHPFCSISITLVQSPRRHILRSILIRCRAMHARFKRKLPKS